MQSVVLINPPALRGFTNERTFSGGIGVSRKLKPGEQEMPIILPIDFLYMAAVAEKVGAKATLVDLLLDRHWDRDAEEYCMRKIEAATEDDLWVGIRLSIPSLRQDLEFANAMKKRLPNAKVFVFGTVIMATIDHWISECRVDFLIYGEPEALFEELLTAQDYRKVKGVIRPKTYVPLAGSALYDGEKNAYKEEAWIKVKNLSDLPRPAWHLLEMGRYAIDGSGDTSKVGVFIQASRGCPIGCTMCPYMLLEGLPWRSNDIEAVVDEIEYLNKTYGIYHIRFRDPNFGFNRKYARELCESIIRRGVKLEATVETSVEVFDEDNLRKMFDAGVRVITTGIETNDEACMASIGQKIKVNDKLREKIDICDKIGFHIYGTYCLGTPEETWETVEKTWRFAIEVGVESGFTVLTPFPGTPMYWRALKEGLLPKRMQFSDWNSYTSTVPTYELSIKDLDMARLWSRLETILPYRQKRAKGLSETIQFHYRHIPHYLARHYCRLYVWYRKARRQSEKSSRPVSPPEEIATAA